MLSCLQTANYTLDPFAALPAKFGSRLSFQGVEGDLVVGPWGPATLFIWQSQSPPLLDVLASVGASTAVHVCARMHADTPMQSSCRPRNQQMHARISGALTAA